MTRRRGDPGPGGASAEELEEATRQLEKHIVQAQPPGDLAQAEERRLALPTGDGLHRPVAETLRRAEVVERVAEQIRQLLELLVAYRLGEDKGENIVAALTRLESDILEIKHWFSPDFRFLRRSPMSRLLDQWRRLVVDIECEMERLPSLTGDAKDRVRQIRKRNNRSWMATQKRAASFQSMLELRAVQLRGIRDKLGARPRTHSELITAGAPAAAAAQRLSLPFAGSLVERATELVLAVPVGTPEARQQVAELLKALVTSAGRSRIEDVRKKCAELLSVDKYMDQPESTREAVQSAHALVNAVLDELKKMSVG